MKTYKAYRMYFCNEYTGQLNKFGGLPTHLPLTWPKDEYGNALTFLCQFYCDEEKMAIENMLCIQLYQWVENGEEGSDPIIVPVPVGAGKNLHGEGLKHPELQEGDIKFEEVIEEVVEEHADVTLKDEKGLHLWYSKLKGWFHEGNITPNRFLGMISDGNGYTPVKGSSPFNWGCGYKLIFYLDEAGDVAWDFY